MQSLKRWLPALAAFAWAVPLIAAHTQARLVLSAASAQPGETVLAGVHLRMDKDWHTYWRNSGASGMPTEIAWELPGGITAGGIQWPLPEKYGEDELTTYVYHDEVVLLVPLKLSADLKPGPLELKATVSWLECKEACIPGDASVSTTLIVGEASNPSAEASLLETWQKALPKDGKTLKPVARWEKAASGDVRPLVLEWQADPSAGEADFFPYSAEDFEVQAPTERLAADTGLMRLRKTVQRFSGDWPKEIGGLVVQKTDNRRVTHEVFFAISASGHPTAGATGSTSGNASQSLWQMLLYAFLGGLILNIMPCVLPVIALKILGFVGQAKENPRRVRWLGLVYTLGVLVSFLALAGLVIGLQAAGNKAGWGFQFGNPYFLVIMTTLVTLIALSLFGVFEVTLGGRAMETAAGLSSQHGAVGAFFNGLLATVLATSCTAPFLGAAVGFAFARPPLLIVLILLTVGLGLAAPYFVLSWQPAWLKFLPKAGPWMERFKVAMGFPMLAAAVWLSSLLTDHYGDRAWWLGVFLVFVAVAAWIYGDFIQRGRERKALAFLFLLVVLTTGYVWALESNLNWRSPQAASASGDSVLKNAPQGYGWQPWSLEAVTLARAQGKVVVVDFTAKWCLTCNTIVKPALESQSVGERLTALGVVALLADYTSFPPAITEELARHNRAGVPLVLVYPRDPSQPPIVLPEAITPGMVLDALERASSP